MSGNAFEGLSEGWYACGRDFAFRAQPFAYLYLRRNLCIRWFSCVAELSSEQTEALLKLNVGSEREFLGQSVYWCAAASHLFETMDFSTLRPLLAIVNEWEGDLELL